MNKVQNELALRPLINLSVDILFDRYANEFMDPLPPGDGLGVKWRLFRMRRSFKRAVKGLVKKALTEANGDETLHYVIFKAYTPIP